MIMSVVRLCIIHSQSLWVLLKETKEDWFWNGVFVAGLAAFLYSIIRGWYWAKYGDKKVEEMEKEVMRVRKIKEMSEYIWSLYKGRFEFKDPDPKISSSAFYSLASKKDFFDCRNPRATFSLSPCCSCGNDNLKTTGAFSGFALGYSCLCGAKITERAIQEFNLLALETFMRKMKKDLEGFDA